MPKDSRKYTAADLIALLRVKYSLPSYAFIEQVPNGTSSNKTRTADAIAMGCWKSVGIELHGFEAKVSRSDWQKEMQQPEKSAVFQKHCHRWWIVAAPGIVKLEEMPSEWGLMEPKSGGGLTVTKAASLRTPEPVTFEFLAALLRKACNDSPERQAIEAAKRQAEEEAFKRDNESFKIESLERQLADAEKAIKDFQAKSGILLKKWTAGDIGEAVQAILRLKQGDYRLRNEISNIKAHAETLLAHAKVLEEYIPAGLEVSP